MFFGKKTKPSDPAPAMPGSSAISLEKVEQQAPGLVSLYKKASVSLVKNGMEGQRAAVYLVLDRSGSMEAFYRRGEMQRLAEQILGLSAHLDDDGFVPLFLFDHQVHPPVAVSLNAYSGQVERTNIALGRMGGTAYAPAIEAVVDHHLGTAPGTPALVIFQTDGEPQDRRAAEAALRVAANLPIFWQFVGFGHARLDFLQNLDTLHGRTVDNAGFFAVGDPSRWTDERLYDAILREYPSWLSAARSAGVLA